MQKNLFTVFMVILLSYVDNSYAHKIQLNNKPEQQKPELKKFWLEDSDGNILNSEASANLGDTISLVIVANKPANGTKANINLQGMPCNFKLLTKPYKIVNGTVNNIIINGDNIDYNDPNRVLKNQTRLRFTVIEESEHCLVDFESNKIIAPKLCRKRSWPYRRWNNKPERLCDNH